MVRDVGIARIKVCGLRGIEDLPTPIPTALDAVGFVGWSRSKRCVTPTQAARVVERLPAHIVPVAVLVEPSPDEARRWLAESQCRALQLCGYETANDWVGFPHPILRRIAVDQHALEELWAWNTIAAAFVLDHPDSPGGTGLAVDASLAREIALHSTCLLAGGLSALDVAERTRLVRPHGVDASSRLEGPDGRKDPELVRAFIAAADSALRRVETTR